jgi:hypothetical protein
VCLVVRRRDTRRDIVDDFSHDAADQRATRRSARTAFLQKSKIKSEPSPKRNVRPFAVDELLLRLASAGVWPKVKLSPTCRRYLRFYSLPLFSASYTLINTFLKFMDVLAAFLKFLKCCLIFFRTISTYCLMLSH